MYTVCPRLGPPPPPPSVYGTALPFGAASRRITVLVTSVLVSRERAGGRRIVILHVEAYVVSVSSSLVFFGNFVQKICSSAPYCIIMTTRGAHIYIDLF